MPKAKKQSKTNKILSWLKPTSPGKSLLLFVIVFAVAGGAFVTLKSFAATGNIGSSSSSGKDVWGCPGNIGSRPDLGYGSAGGCVKRVQFLTDVIWHPGNYSPPESPLKIDGQFGLLTKNQIVSFQKVEGLNADGIVGQRTWHRLECRANVPYQTWDYC